MTNKNDRVRPSRKLTQIRPSRRPESEFEPFLTSDSDRKCGIITNLDALFSLQVVLVVSPLLAIIVAFTSRYFYAFRTPYSDTLWPTRGSQDTPSSSGVPRHSYHHRGPRTHLSSQGIQDTPIITGNPRKLLSLQGVTGHSYHHRGLQNTSIITGSSGHSYHHRGSQDTPIITGSSGHSYHHRGSKDTLINTGGFRTLLSSPGPRTLLSSQGIPGHSYHTGDFRTHLRILIYSDKPIRILLSSKGVLGHTYHHRGYNFAEMQL